MKLYTLVYTKEWAGRQKTYQLLAEACQHNDIDLVPIELNRQFFDADSSARLLETNQSWIRLAIGNSAGLAEKILIREDLSTIYDSWRIKLLGGQWSDTLLMLKNNLPIIPTIFLFGGLDNQTIEQAVEKLGGFPVVLKFTGLSHGQGVFSCSSVNDINTHLEKGGPPSYGSVALRKFIPDARHIRAVVVGSECADAIEYDKQPDDFRTNAVKVPTAKSVDLPEDISNLAVQSAKANGLRFTGIDILIGADQAYVAELNNPFNYARNYLTNGKNLAIDLVQMLSNNIDKNR